MPLRPNPLSPVTKKRTSNNFDSYRNAGSRARVFLLWSRNLATLFSRVYPRS